MKKKVRNPPAIPDGAIPIEQKRIFCLGVDPAAHRVFADYILKAHRVHYPRSPLPDQISFWEV